MPLRRSRGTNYSPYIYNNNSIEKIQEDAIPTRLTFICRCFLDTIFFFFDFFESVHLFTRKPAKAAVEKKLQSILLFCLLRLSP